MSAYGTLGLPSLPYVGNSAGIQTQLGTIIPPAGGRIAAYVRSTGKQTGDDEAFARRIVTTLNKGLAQCRSGKPDVVVVLPGHAENISAADYASSLVAGTRIIGLGSGALRPTFTWTVNGSTFLLDVADVEIHNCILQFATAPGTTTAATVAAPITVSAAGCGIFGCRINFGIDADQKVTVGITTTAAADDFSFVGNRCYSDVAATCVTFLRLVGADRARILDNEIIGATTAVAIGLIQFITTDSLHVTMDRNKIYHILAASEACVSMSAGATSSTGFIDNLHMVTLANSANQLVLGHASGAWGLSVALFGFGRHIYVTNLAGERAAEVTVVSA